MKTRIFALLFLLLSAPAFAAYTTATTVLVEKTATGLRVLADITGDAGEKLIPAVPFYVASFVDLQAQVAAFLTKINVASTDSGKIAPGQVITAPTVAVTPPPTAEQQFFSDLYRFYGVDKAVQAGLVDASSKEYAALKALVLSEFNAAYLADPGWPVR